MRDHRALVLWAADCAERVLPYFEEKYPKDARPRKAVEAARAWARGEIALSEVRAAAFAAHAAARAATYAATDGSRCGTQPDSVGTGSPPVECFATSGGRAGTPGQV